MCVAIVIPDGPDVVLPTDAELGEMEESNPHGAGVAWVASGRVRWIKALDAVTAGALVRSLPRPLLVHFRWASAGGQSRGLCHPFPVANGADTRLNGDASEVLIHNGHWGGWETCMRDLRKGGWKFPKGAWSDTRLMAHLMAESTEADKAEILAVVGGRVATLSADGSWSAHGRWEKIGGVHYSNTYWRTQRKWAGPDSAWWSEHMDGRYPDPQSRQGALPSLPSLASESRVPDWESARERRGLKKYWGNDHED